jgi:hypothetical protein
MYMEDLLPGGFPISQKQIHSLTAKPTGSQRCRESMRDAHQMGRRFSVEVPKEGGMLIWDDEYVSRIDGLNVHERCTSVVTIDIAGRLTAIEYLADDAFTFL